MPQEYTTYEVARYIGISPSTVRAWAKNGKIRGQKKHGMWMFAWRAFSKYSKPMFIIENYETRQKGKGD